MKKLLNLFILGLALLSIGWISESGGGVVSETGNILRTSIEATAVLQSDAMTRLYVETRLGGAANYASFDSGGVLDFRNVSSSSDKVVLNNDDKLRWLLSDGSQVRVGVSADDRFVLRVSLDAETVNVSADRILATSIDVTEYSAQGTPGISSIYTTNTGTCNLTFLGGLLTASSC